MSITKTHLNFISNNKNVNYNVLVSVSAWQCPEPDSEILKYLPQKVFQEIVHLKM